MLEDRTVVLEKAPFFCNVGARKEGLRVLCSTKKKPIRIKLTKFGRLHQRSRKSCLHQIFILVKAYALGNQKRSLLTANCPFSFFSSH